MSNPHSRLTKTRFALSRWLDPYPDKGEAWCMDCTLNDGRTLILNAAAHADHVERHREATEGTGVWDGISIRANFGKVAEVGPEGEDLR
jgi:hypothetical protein